MKNYIGISRDHSVSMQGITRSAMEDYNSTIASIKQEASKHSIDTIVSVVKCGVGYGAAVVREVSNSSIDALKPITSYVADGDGTPLLDSIGELIEMFESVPDYNDPQVSFAVMAITDGAENRSRKYNWSSLMTKIKKLQDSDRWTFIFRVPMGAKSQITKYGIPEGNVLEWEQTVKGYHESTVATQSAFSGYYTARSLGQTSSSKFYADLSNVTTKELVNTLVDISPMIKTLRVTPKHDGSQIRDFIEANKVPFVKGNSYYQLTKTETVQEYKEIIIVDKLKGNAYTGAGARDILGLPKVGEIKLVPGNISQYNVFVQSTSVNRKVVSGTSVIVYA